jgi:integrase
MRLDAIGRADLARWLAAMAQDKGAITANRARTSMSAAFSWAMREGLVDQNPVVGTNKAAEERPRERVLSLDELRLIWRATEGPGDYNTIVRLLLLTGQRREEVAGMRWSELDLDRAQWLLPSERTKNRRPHIVPLSAPALELLQVHPQRVGRELVFGEGAGGYSGWSRAKERLDARLARLRQGSAGDPDGSQAPWTLHDLRRSFATHASEELAVAPHVIEAVLNHVSGYKSGVAGVYNRATYLREKTDAMQRWAEFVVKAGE